MAIVLMRKTGFPLSSSPYGITDPKGNPSSLRESVERLPIRPNYNNVRARSANVVSAAAGWLVASPGPACFPIGDEVIVVFTRIAGLISIPRVTFFTTDFGGRIVAQPELCSAGHCGNYARLAAIHKAIRQAN
jgi:hypothetical protein